jgi:hypothetical protein
MAGTIPVYESKKGIDLQLVPRMSNDGSNRTARAGEGLTNAANNAIDTMTKVQETQEQNAANVYATEQLTKLKTMADNDPDFKSSDKYAKEIARIGGDAAKTISGANAREAFTSRFKLASNGTMEGIQATFRKRQLDAAHADLLTGIEAQKEAYFGATYPQEKMMAAALIKQSITDNVNGLVITAEDGAKLWQAIQDELPAKDASRDVGKDPYLALQRLRTNSYGIKDEEKRADLIKDAQQSILRLEKMEEKGLAQAKEKLAIDLTQKLWDGTLTISQIKDEMDQGILDKKDAEVLHKALISERTSEIQNMNENQKALAEKKHAGTYVAMWDMILKKGKAADKRRALMKEFADGNLKREDAMKLYTGYLIPRDSGGKSSLAEEYAAEEADAARNHFLRGAMQQFRKFWNIMNSTNEDEGDE